MAQNENDTAVRRSEDQLFVYYLLLNDPYKEAKNWTEETHAVIQTHQVFLEKLGEEGKLILAGRALLEFDDPNLFGIALIKAGNLEEARRMMEQDPAVKHGIQQFSIYPISLAMHYFGNVE